MSGDLGIGPGSSLGSYRIESLIGRGGMGVVYLAEHVTLGRRVALKVVAPELVTDAAFRERFLREARLAASLDHPNIIPVYDAGDAGGVVYLAMRYIEGENLGHVLEREGRLSVERTLDILTKVASALDEAHRSGLVHRDVKPDNVLLGAGDGVYLTDFGLVRQLDSQTRLTKTGFMMGTLNYMAPEMFRGQDIDARTDAYSLACVLFECLTGEPPFARDQQTAVISAHLIDPPPAVTAFRPELPGRIDEVVAAGMAKDRVDRPSGCGVLIASAAAALMGEQRDVATVLPPPAVEETAFAPPPPAPTERRAADAPPPPAPEPQAPTRRGWLPWAALVVAVAAAAFVIPNLLDDEPTGRIGSTGATNGGTGATNGASGTTGVRDPEVEVIGMIEGVPASIGLDFGAVWVGSDDGSRGLISRVEPSSGATDLVEVGRRPARMTFTGDEQDGSVWTADQIGDSVSRVDVPLVGTTSETFDAGDGPIRIQSPKGSPFVWVANGEGHTLTRIDSETGDVTTVNVGKDPRGLSSSPGRVVSANHGDGTITIVEAETLVVTATIPVGTSPSSILNVDPFLWVANAGDGTLDVIDPSTEAVVETIEVGPQPAGLTNDFLGSMWVRNEGSTTVSRIDIEDFTVAGPIDVGGRPIATAVTPGAVWVAVANGTVVRIDVDDASVQPFELACLPVTIISEPDPSIVAPELSGVWVACEDGTILRIPA